MIGSLRSQFRIIKQSDTRQPTGLLVQGRGVRFRCPVFCCQAVQVGPARAAAGAQERPSGSSSAFLGRGCYHVCTKPRGSGQKKCHRTFTTFSRLAHHRRIHFPSLNVVLALVITTTRPAHQLMPQERPRDVDTMCGRCNFQITCLPVARCGLASLAQRVRLRPLCAPLCGLDAPAANSVCLVRSCVNCHLAASSAMDRAHVCADLTVNDLRVVA